MGSKGTIRMLWMLMVLTLLIIPGYTARLRSKPALRPDRETVGQQSQPRSDFRDVDRGDSGAVSTKDVKGR